MKVENYLKDYVVRTTLYIFSEMIGHRKSAGVPDIVFSILRQWDWETIVVALVFADR